MGGSGSGRGGVKGTGIGRSGGNRSVLITGVSKGLGRALAIELANRGHTIIGCSRAQEKLDSLESLLTPNNNQHLFLNADVTCNNSVAEMARIVMEKNGGPPDMIVNGAGTINTNKKMWEVPAEEFDLVMDTNLKGSANVLRHFIPVMLKKNEGEGIIVNMSSGWGRSGAALVAPYCASKWAIEGLTKSVAKELPQGMAVVALNPGVINTDMLASCFGASASMYQSPQLWALKAATMILNLTPADNGASLSV
ncbi:unnamed protein product [Vicia faba]|uniref:NADPH-dependent pterin aldehyde reductase n=1 Tax=Vicia faba TaxID=3906 RepID=A0AAV1B148_VICFA|nr:unnamed protein product [Vicia faba]